MSPPPKPMSPRLSNRFELPIIDSEDETDVPPLASTVFALVGLFEHAIYSLACLHCEQYRSLKKWISCFCGNICDSDETICFYSWWYHWQTRHKHNKVGVLEAHIYLAGNHKYVDWLKLILKNSPSSQCVLLFTFWMARWWFGDLT